MPFATNALDGRRIYFEEWPGPGSPVVLYSGFMDPMRVSQDSVTARALRDDHHLVFPDHRGHGRSDKPHDPASYLLATRVLDHVAVLDELGIDRAHVFGSSWGARLGFAIGAHAPERVLSLTLCGNHPYAWDLDGPVARAVFAAAEASETGGMDRFVSVFEARLGISLPEPARTLELDNDPAALRAAVRAVLAEGPIDAELEQWRFPCLIYAGALDEMHDAARRAAEQIPDAIFISLPGHTHISAEGEGAAVLDLMRAMLARAG